jgi:dihydrofolate synthase/folylpolyglutamate synthase
VTLAILDALAERWDVAIDEAALRRGLAAARWPGRLELLDGGTLGAGRVLLDGAHNPAGAAALAVALADLGLRRPTIVFGAMRGKKVGQVLRALLPLRPDLVFTRVADAGAHDPEDLERTWRRVAGRRGRTAATPREAIAMAADRGSDPIVVAGSLYLVGAVRGMISDGIEEA